VITVEHEESVLLSFPRVGVTIRVAFVNLDAEQRKEVLGLMTALDVAGQTYCAELPPKVPKVVS